jgi:hypothetical protein
MVHIGGRWDTDFKFNCSHKQLYILCTLDFDSFYGYEFVKTRFEYSKFSEAGLDGF